MKRLFLIILVMVISLTSCEMLIDDLSGPEPLSNIVLYDGVMNDTTILLFNKTMYDFPNSNIQIKIEFGDPGAFSGYYLLQTSESSVGSTIKSYSPDFIANHTIDLSVSYYFRILSFGWDQNNEYFGQDIPCKIIWIRN